MPLGCAWQPEAASVRQSASAAATNELAEARQILAPSGRLRIAVYPGSPTSLVKLAGQERGVTVEIGRELARRLGVPAELQRRLLVDNPLRLYWPELRG